MCFIEYHFMLLNHVMVQISGTLVECACHQYIRYRHIKAEQKWTTYCRKHFKLIYNCRACYSCGHAICHIESLGTVPIFISVYCNYGLRVIAHGQWSDNKRFGLNHYMYWYMRMRECVRSIEYDYNDAIMNAIAYQITGISIVFSMVCSGADQWKHLRFATLVFVREIHRQPLVPLTKHQ